MNGFAGQFSRAVAESLSSNPNVQPVTEDPIWSIAIVPAWTDITFKPAEGPLDFIQTLIWSPDQLDLNEPRRQPLDPAPLVGPYQYTPSAGGGAGEHGGRASWGTSFVGGLTDQNGHGTHVAAKAAGRTYGVAPNANLIAVQVLDKSGKGAVSGIIAAIAWVVTEHGKRGGQQPSVINLSLKGKSSTLLDLAVRSAIAAGVHVCAAAGNSADDASKYSPGKVNAILTIGASDITDARTSFSSYGNIVDVYAPGQSITSAWIGTDSSTHILSGTSQATPHVAGAVALVISALGQKNPADMGNTIRALAKTSLSSLKVLQVPS